MQLLHSDGQPNWEALIDLICATRGITHEDLSHRVHCTVGDLEDWSRGITQPSYEQAEALWHLSPRKRADVLGQHATDPELLGQDPEPIDPGY